MSVGYSPLCIYIYVIVISRYGVISLLLHESEAEPRTSVITMISSEYTEYNCFISQCAGVHRSVRIIN